MKRLTLKMRPQARLDLLEIWHYIHPQSPQNAADVMEAIESAMRSLLEMPGMGHLRADVRSARYRFWTVKSWVIAYRFDDRTLTVVRVVHGARDFRKLFRSKFD